MSKTFTQIYIIITIVFIGLFLSGLNAVSNKYEDDIEKLNNEIKLKNKTISEQNHKITNYINTIEKYREENIKVECDLTKTPDGYLIGGKLYKEGK